MQERVVVLGDGQMALVMADAIAERGMAVRVWSPFKEDAAALGRSRLSPRLKNFHLTEAVEVTSDDAGAFEGVTLVVNAIPTQFIRGVWERLRGYLPAGVPIVSVSKGIEKATLLRPTQVIAELVGEGHGLCVVSGPSIAAELAGRLPATMVAASGDRALGQRVQELLDVPWLRIYTHDDVVGVELAGATKNVIALAAGMIDGLRAGDNAKSALLARGLSEIARLGAALGARLDTFFGIAGVGDLATTCFSPEGRNRSCGERLGRGEKLEVILAESASVVEGVPTTQSVVELAGRHDVEMPITRAVHAILFEGLTPREAIASLMSREKKVEQVG